MRMRFPLIASLRTTRRLIVGLCLTLICSEAVLNGQLYTEGPGVNPPFEEIRDDITNGFWGTEIDVNNAAVEGGLFGDFGIQDDLRLHTLANSSVGQGAHGNWSRWYQTDGATQVFRLFPGEENVRPNSSGVVRPLAARIEAFDRNTGWNVDDGEWHDWVGRYTIVKPINATIFQAKDTDDDDWSVALGMNESGSVFVTHRRPAIGQPQHETLVQNAIGQPFDVRIRDNGLDYEVYFGDQTVPFTSGQYIRNDEPGDDSDTRFRWGMYVGSNPVIDEGMIFVSHASVDPVVVDESDLVAGWSSWSEVAPDTWDASQLASGIVAQATGTPEAGGVWFNFNNATVDNGASSDGRYGAMGPTGADTSVSLPTDGVTLSNGYDGYIDFTLTDTTGITRSLTGFHFETGAFRINAATDWELEVLAGDITVGSLASGTATVNAGPMQDDVSIYLGDLVDSTLEANGSVTFRLNFTGGTADPGSPASGHHLFLDNVAVTGVAIDGDFTGPSGTPDGVWDCLDIDALTNVVANGGNDLAFDLNGDGAVTFSDVTDPTTGWLAIGGANNAAATGGNAFLAGDANLDGAVDGQDFIVWNDNRFTTEPHWCSANFTGDQSIDGQDFIVWNDNKFISTDNAAVPEPSSFVTILLLACMAIRRAR